MPPRCRQAGILKMGTQFLPGRDSPQLRTFIRWLKSVA
jgi:hypothetical protein